MIAYFAPHLEPPALATIGLNLAQLTPLKRLVDDGELQRAAAAVTDEMRDSRSSGHLETWSQRSKASPKPASPRSISAARSVPTPTTQSNSSGERSSRTSDKPDQPSEHARGLDRRPSAPARVPQ